MSPAARPRGQFGVAIALSSPAVAARCAHARAGIGAVSTQNVTIQSVATVDQIAEADRLPCRGSSGFGTNAPYRVQAHGPLLDA
ncbi:DUF1028 domain-containing protein [Dongia deserti]|nr:DUF1028 domain-containing protein [Dongia deserti]